MAESNEGEKDESMMEEALNILKQEGFSLPTDVIDTLTEASRANPGVRRKGSLRGHRMCEVQSNTRKQRNVRETSSRRGDRRSSSYDTADESPDTNKQQDNVASAPADTDAVNETRDVSEARESVKSERSEKEDRSESSSSCSASTVKENLESQVGKQNGYGGAMSYDHPAIRPQLSRQDSESSIASSASSMNRKLNQLGDRRGSSSTDCGYNTSIENAKQVHEARAENLKNMNKDIENKISGRSHNGIKREISRDSGFTENLDAQRLTPSSFSTDYSSQVPVVGDSTTEFKDMAISNSDYKEQSLSTDHGEAQVITSTASDLTAAEMASRGNEIRADGTVVSTSSKLADEEGNSALSRLTTKVTDDAVTKMEDFESENRRTKSSRNDSISTSPSGVTTASSRHASSMDQELNQDNSEITASNDGKYVASSMSAAQQLTRNQEMDNIEQSTDGSSRSEHKKTSDKSSLSKSNREETKLSDDGRTSDTISASQELESKANAVQNEENTTSADGTKSMRRQDSTTSSFSEKSSSEKKTVKQLPYSGGSSTEMSSKQDSSKVSKSSKSFNEVKESCTGRTEKSNKEDSNAMSSSFSGKCESTEMMNGSKLHKTMSTENSSENKVKSVSSNKTYTTSGQTNEYPTYPRERRLSDASNASTLSNMSGLSRENIKPPSYEETMSNLSRAHSNSSLFSRQDSSASSIASSAGAFNERQRQKALENARGSSFDSNTDVKEVSGAAYDTRRGYGRQDSYSSDSTLSGGREEYTYRRNGNNTYQKPSYDAPDHGFSNRSNIAGRVINHPIKQVGQATYSRSFTDSVYERQPNRRATLGGDIVLSEREMAEAREEVRAKVRGKDDSYVSRRSSAGRDADLNRDTRETGRGFRSGFDSFGREIMDIVDSFFDDDDDFGFGLTSRGRRRSLDRSNEALNRRREAQNPYTVREDLSRFSSSREGQLDSVGMSRSQVEYAASDSGFQTNRRDRDIGNNYSNNYGRVISDSVSECGYDRYRPRTVDNRAVNIDSYNENRYSDYGSLDRKRTKTASREYTGSREFTGSREYTGSRENIGSRVNDTTSAGDSLQSAGKSITRDKKANSSILSGDRRADIVRSSASSNNYTRYGGVHDDRYIGSSARLNDAYSRTDSETDMSDSGSVAYSFRSLPPEVNQLSRGQGVIEDNQSTHSLPDFSYEGRQRRSSGKQKIDDSRRQRIDKALTWIRSELGELRTQDRVLMTQFQRCQDSIEQLKKQRPWYEVYSDEEGDEGRHWEDWEIDDFDRSCQTERRENGATPRTNKSGTVITKEYQRMSIKSTE